MALGNVSCVQCKFDEAIKIYEKALALEPNSAFAKSYLGEAQLFKGEKEKAIKTLEEASEWDPKGKSGDFARSLIDLVQKGFNPNPGAVKGK